MSASDAIRFTSELPVEHRERLEDILFFNQSQSEYRDVVIESIERFGEPRLVAEKGRLRLSTSLLGPVQTLFAVAQEGDESRPIGAALYSRTTPDTMTLLHVAVHAEFAATGPRAGELVTLRLIAAVTRASSRIKGITRVALLYGGASTTPTEIPLRGYRTP